jgi:putative transposase
VVVAAVDDVVVRAGFPHQPEDMSARGRIICRVKVRYTYRARSSRVTERVLGEEWDRCRWVWNKCVEADRDAWADGQRRLAYKDLNRLLTGWRAGQEWLRQGSSVAQQQTIRDFCAARGKALKDRKARLGRQGRGMPRFKSKRIARPSMNYTRRGFGVRDGTLVLAGGIALRPVWSRDLPSDPSSVRVFQDALGRWHVSFVVEHDVEALPETGRDVGIDFGIKAVATCSDRKHDLPHSHHGDRAAQALARYQRQMCRRRPKRGQRTSNGYRKAKRHAAKVHAKVANQRQDEARKWAVNVVRSFDRIAAEDLSTRFMFANRSLARRAADARIAAAKRALADAAAKHGRTLVWVSASHTTMDCSACGARAKHRLPLSQRTYLCEACGHTQDRDENAANVMLARAGFNPAGVDRVRREEPRVRLAA